MRFDPKTVGCSPPIEGCSAFSKDKLAVTILSVSQFLGFRHTLSDLYRFRDFIQSDSVGNSEEGRGVVGGGGDDGGEKLYSHGGLEAAIGEIDTFELLRISYKSKK